MNRTIESILLENERIRALSKAENKAMIATIAENTERQRGGIKNQKQLILEGIAKRTEDNIQTIQYLIPFANLNS